MKNILIKSSAFLLTSLFFLLLFFTMIYTNAQEVEDVSLYSDSTDLFTQMDNDLLRINNISNTNLVIDNTTYGSYNLTNNKFSYNSISSYSAPQFIDIDLGYTTNYDNMCLYIVTFTTYSTQSISFYNGDKRLLNYNQNCYISRNSMTVFNYNFNKIRFYYNSINDCESYFFIFGNIYSPTDVYSYISNYFSSNSESYSKLLDKYNLLVNDYNDLVAENQRLQHLVNDGYNSLFNDYVSLQDKYNKLSSAISSNYFNNDVVEFVNFYNKLNDELLISYPVSNVDSDGLLDFSFILDTIKNDHGLIECYAILKYKNYAPVKLINGKYIAQSFCDVIFYNDNEIISSFDTGSDNNELIVDNSSFANDVLINKIKFEFGELSNTNMLFYYDTHLYEISKQQYDLGFKNGYDNGFLNGSANYSFFNLCTGLDVKYYDNQDKLYKTFNYSLTELLNLESKPLDIVDYSLSIFSPLFHLNNSFEILEDSSGEVTFYYDKGSVSTDSYNFFVLDGDWETTIDIFTWNGKVYSLSKIDDVSSIYLSDNDYIRSIKFNIRYIANFSQSILKTTSEYTKGYQTGYDQGHTDGFNEGNDTGYKKGWDTGYSSGSDYTYNKIDKNSPNYLQGYNAGRLYQNANGGDINSIVYTFTNCLFSSPINILKSCLNFDFFGINLFSLFTSLITICLCFWVIRIFLGKK